MSAVRTTTMTWAVAENLASQNVQQMPATCAHIRNRRQIAMQGDRAWQWTGVWILLSVIITIMIIAIFGYTSERTLNKMGIVISLVASSLVAPALPGWLCGIYYDGKEEKMGKNAALSKVLFQDLGLIERQGGHEQLAKTIRLSFAPGPG